MKRITKKSILEQLPRRKDGELTKPIIDEMLELVKTIKPNQEIGTFSWSGKGRKYRGINLVNLDLLEKFTTFSEGNDAPRGGREGDYIILSTKEYNNFKKRIAYFIDVEQILKEREEARQELKKKMQERYEFNKEEQRRKREKKARFSNVEHMELEKWINLPKDEKHPCPKNILKLKTESGLTWYEFENQKSAA